MSRKSLQELGNRQRNSRLNRFLRQFENQRQNVNLRNVQEQAELPHRDENEPPLLRNEILPNNAHILDDNFQQDIDNLQVDDQYDENEPAMNEVIRLDNAEINDNFEEFVENMEDIISNRDDQELNDEYQDSDNEDNDNNSNVDSGDDGNDHIEPEAQNNERNNDDNDAPLYHGAQITLQQSMLLILALQQKHHPTESCIADFIEVINLHCPRQDLRKNSLYKFNNYFAMEETGITKHFYCTLCHRALETVNDICPTCTRNIPSYFVKMALLPQLSEMYRRNDFLVNLQWRNRRPRNCEHVITDIYDGALYKEWVDNGFLSNPSNISLSWYTDGIPCFKSSHISIWPLYFTVNELPFQVRKQRENTLLIGFWFGDKKPDINRFFSSVREDLETLWNGVNLTTAEGNILTIRAILMTGTCDLPAKSECMNFTQFNGDYGCSRCLIRGHRVPINPENVAAGVVHVYPHTENLLLRTRENCIEFANRATIGVPCMGVKGASALINLMPDYIRGIASDRMHLVDAGVTKKTLTLLFDVKYRHCPFSLHAVIDVVDQRLKLIKPPKFIHRMPRSLTELVHWKASEMKAWLFYYSLPLLKSVMRPDYYQHYLLLVIGVVILSSDRITVPMINVAHDFLNKFVREFEILYGPQYCSINVHQLLHLSDNVKNLGPLFTHTCYEYENLNGQILKLIHGTTHIDSQIAKSHRQFLSMITLTERIPEGEIRDFCLRKKKQVKILERIDPCCYSVGIYKNFTVIPEIINNFVNEFEIEHYSAWQYLRLLKSGKIYVSQMYPRATQTKSSIIMYSENNLKKFGNVLYFVKISECNCQRAVCDCINNRHYAVLHEINSSYVLHTRGDQFAYGTNAFFHVVVSTNVMKIISIDDILTTCVYMNFDNEEYIAIPPNNAELE